MVPIDTLVRKLNKAKAHLAHLLSKPVVVPIFLIISGLLLSTSVKPKAAEIALGGPAPEDSASISENSDVAIVASDASLDELTDEDIYNTGTTGFIILDNAMAMDSGAVFFGSDATARDGILTYRVEKGDTLSVIAQKFGIDVSTILGANKIGATIHEGEDLKILPFKGITVKVKSGDTISGLAAQYHVSGQAILAANTIAGTLSIGQDLIIPGAKPAASALTATQSRSRLPAWPTSIEVGPPTTGYNWRIAHGPQTNATDIANTCKTPVVSAAAGTVVLAQYGWNGGYGNEVRVSHGQGVTTIYGHFNTLSVTEGQYVEKGQLIGFMGNTGNVKVSPGGTGCHLHFDVIGARNPYL